MTRAQQVLGDAKVRLALAKDAYAASLRQVDHLLQHAVNMDAGLLDEAAAVQENYRVSHLARVLYPNEQPQGGVAIVHDSVDEAMGLPVDAVERDEEGQ